MATKKTTTNPKKDITSVEATSTPQSLFSKPRILLIIILIGVLLYIYRGLFVVAIVNNKPIFRHSVIKELEKQGGKQTAEALISQELIKQEAAKKNISVSTKEINDELDKIEKQLKDQGQDLNEILDLQNLTRKDIEDQTEIQLTLQKLLADKIKVSKAEVDEAFEKAQESLPEGTDEKQAKADIEESLKNQKLSEAIQPWLLKIQEEANIKYILEY